MRANLYTRYIIYTYTFHNKLKKSSPKSAGRMRIRIQRLADSGLIYLSVEFRDEAWIRSRGKSCRN